MGTVIQLSTREVLILIGAFAGLVFGFGRLLLAQFEKRMAERFAAMEELREAEVKHRDNHLETIERGLREAKDDVLAVSKRVERLSDELPRQYVTREDWIRFATTVDAKLDRVMELIMRNWRGTP